MLASHTQLFSTPIPQLLQYVLSPPFSPELIHPVCALQTKLAFQRRSLSYSFAWRVTNWRQQQDEPVVAWQGAVRLINLNGLERACVGSKHWEGG
jgi:hypothetical protein